MSQLTHPATGHAPKAVGARQLHIRDSSNHSSKHIHLSLATLVSCGRYREL
jgi:hypothetical protein